ncbi:MAG TPA: pentapeptide repeat-containing protein [Chitinispirillaceae bacterium]|nr:pentapeptide repeat-containing protein [Chitinispirillaceae bacterium]
MPLTKSIICIYAIFTLNGSADQSPTMYLCLDSMMQKYKQDGKSPPKLVYGYINGKKTECMCEYELRARFSEVELKERKSTEIDSQQLLESSGKRRSIKDLKIEDYVFRGKKNLAGADLRGYDLNGMDLSGADLNNANLESADLRNANLSNANLRGTSLEFAYLKNANLKNADLSNARLRGAYLQNANLSGVEGLTMEHIQAVATVYNAVFDSDMMELIKEYCPGKMKDTGWGWRTAVNEAGNAVADKKSAKRK